MRINQNISAMNTYSRLTGANNSKSKSLEKLSSGLRINRAGDDAAGLAISEKMRGQVGGLKQAVRNAQDGISLIQTAEGALNETHSILGRMRDLAVQSSSDTNTTEDRAEIQKEMDQLASEMTRISNTTEFNTKNLLNGQLTDTTFHIGANSGQSIELGISAMDAFSLGVASDKDVASADKVEGNVASVNFGRDLGDAIVDGAEITLSYTEEVIAKDAVEAAAATAGTATGKLNLDDFNKDFITDGAKTLTINGKAVSFATNTSAAGTEFTVDTLATHINTALDDGGTAGANGVIAIGADGTFTITDAGTGKDSKIVIEGTDADLLGDVETVDGKDEAIQADAIEAKSAYVTITDGNGNTDKVDVTGDANSFKVTDKDSKFAGLEVVLAKGQKLSGLALEEDIATTPSTDKFKIAVKTLEATESVDGEEAVAAAGIDVSTQEAADAAITVIDEATAKVSEERSKLGSIQNRLDHTINNLTATAENLSAAESRIRDVDMAEEMMEFTKNNILSQAATSMLAQANQMPQSVLQLLQ